MTNKRPTPWLPIARQVVDSCQSEDGLDLTTAQVLITVHDKLSPGYRHQFETYPVHVAADIAWKLAARQG